MKTTRGLLVMDVDSTLINEEVIDLLAAHAGRGEEVARITASAMAGGMNFAHSLRLRVRALAGLPATLLAQVSEQVTLTQGAPTLVRAALAHDWEVVLLSGGFGAVIAPVAASLGITHVRANTLEIVDEQLTGEVTGEIVDGAAKARHLREFAAEYGVSPAHTVAVGDGANDIQMLQAAGLGVAFCAKPALREVADEVVTQRDLGLVWLLCASQVS